jgi:tRNA-dihydrouridine synthase
VLKSKKFMLSPMAGVTNAPFRQICKEYGGDLGLYVDEMVAARSISGHIRKVRPRITFAPNEDFRSLQLHCLEPEYAGMAAESIVRLDLADHIDLNFGCPVKKITKNGGGSAIPLRPELLRDIIRTVKQNAGDLPISAKFRLGFDESHMHYLQTGEIAYQEGCELVTLHARTTAY